jgi:hypothetical protein
MRELLRSSSAISRDLPTIFSFLAASAKDISSGRTATCAPDDSGRSAEGENPVETLQYFSRSAYDFLDSSSWICNA